MSVDGFRGNPEQMKQMVELMIQCGNTFGQALDRLEQEIQPTLSEWEGESKNVYIECQKSWDALAKELQQFLLKAAEGVEGVANIYRQQDVQAAAGFGA